MVKEAEMSMPRKAAAEAAHEKEERKVTMLRSVVRKAMAVGRFVSAVFGLALVLGLMFGVATMALGANGANFILGQGNAATALTRLTGSVQGPSMQVQNNHPGADDTALSLAVQQGEAPMRVNSDRAVANLNADKVDGRGFSCPAGTLFHEGVCIESTSREAADHGPASSACLDERRRLPTVAELQTFRNRSGTDFDDLEYTSEVESSSFGTVVVAVSPSGALTGIPFDAGAAYRCVVPPS